jgi:hypothetical protein
MKFRRNGQRNSSAGKVVAVEVKFFTSSLDSHSRERIDGWRRFEEQKRSGDIGWKRGQFTSTVLNRVARVWNSNFAYCWIYMEGIPW